MLDISGTWDENKMLVLFETPAGFAVFKLLSEKKLRQSENLYEDFATLDGAKKVVKLKMFEKFEDTTEALASATAVVEGKMSKGLKKLLKKVIAEDAHEKLAVADAKLGQAIKSKLELDCVHDSAIAELMRCIRSQLSGLISGLQVSLFYTPPLVSVLNKAPSDGRPLRAVLIPDEKCLVYIDDFFFLSALKRSRLI